MKYILFIIFAACIQSCEQKPQSNHNDLVVSWSADGKTMIITRKGVMFASFRNNTDTCFVQLYGPDGIVDADVSYYDVSDTVGVSETKNIILNWGESDGSFKTVAYDNKGNIVTPDTTSEEK